MEMIGRKWILTILVVCIAITISFIYLSIPRFPIFKNEINMTDYISCLEKKESEFSGNVVPGDIIISFTELTMNDEARQLLKKYGLDTSNMNFPGDYLVRVDFTGNESGFIEYLENTEGVIEASRWHTNVFVVRFSSDFPKKQVRDFINSYEGIKVDNILFSIGYAWGVIKVNPGEEKYYACELDQYEIVFGTQANSRGTFQLF